MKLAIAGLIFAILLLLGYYLISNKKIEMPTPLRSNVQPQDEMSKRKEATFAIFTNGTFRVFTDPKYHELSQEVYIESSNPNLIHINGSVLWEDFFKTLPMKLTKDCLTTGTGQVFCTNSSQKLRFFINKKENPDALSEEIKNGDQLLVTYGSEAEAQIQSQLLQVPQLK